MSNDIVDVVFCTEPQIIRYFAIYRGYDGKILEWHDIDNLLSEHQKANLPKVIREQLKCDGTALISAWDIANEVLKAISKS